MTNFALLGVAGYIAPRHLQAIKDVEGHLVCASDPNDSVGVLDRYFFETRYFREFERFDRHVEKLRRRKQEERVHYVSICSPNYLHDAHMRFALRVGAHAICEKPLVINPWNLEPLTELEQEQGKRIYTVLQLRVHPTLVALRERLQQSHAAPRREVVLTYVTSRGQWYLNSWKGDLQRSGGIATNIGIHFFDLLLWLFGRVQGYEVHVSTPQSMSGYLELERANVRWFLSIDRHDLPFEARPGGPTTHRSITVDGQELEFSDGFTDLHTRIYREILAGRGFSVEDARPAIVLTHGLRNATPVGVTARAHERVSRRR
jgi:UDP-N-acetyl-2-amino-2-deoxyglucuronate dehydrogenase